MPGLPGKLANPPDLTKQIAQANARDTMAGKAADLNRNIGGTSQRTIIQPPKASGFGKLSDLSGGRMPMPDATSGLQNAVHIHLHTPTESGTDFSKIAKLVNKRRGRK
jgi:hypothetical protein